MERLNLTAKSLILFAACLAVFLINLDSPMIYILDEAKNAECAREMFESGNYIVPYFNGQLRTDKPPLHYFFMALSYKMFGVSAFSARFFSAVFGAMTILISFLFCRKYLSEKKALLTALVLLSSLHFNFQMRMSVPDPYLIFFMTSGFMTFYLYLTDDKKYWLWLMYISFGLGLLTKGPVALGLPGLIMFVFLLISKRFSWPVIRSFNIIIGILIMLAIALPWYWLNYLETNGVWTEGFFFKHNLQRFSDTMEGHGGFFLLPLLMVIAGLLPLGVFGLQALVGNFKRGPHEVILFTQIIVLGIVIFFSLSQTKLPNYTTPAYPFMAISIAWLFSKTLNGQASLKGIRWGYWVYLVIATAIPIAVYFALKVDPNVNRVAWVWICFISMPAGALVAGYYLKRNKLSYFTICIGLSAVVTNILFFSAAYPAVYNINPVSSSVDSLRNKPKLVYYKMMNSAYIFNLQRVIPLIDTQEGLSRYIKMNPDATVISRKQYAGEILSAANFVLIFEQRDTFEKPLTVTYELR